MNVGYSFLWYCDKNIGYLGSIVAKQDREWNVIIVVFYTWSTSTLLQLPRAILLPLRLDCKCN